MKEKKLLKGGRFFSKKVHLQSISKINDIIYKYKWAINRFALEKMLYDDLFGFSKLVYDHSLFEKYENFVFHATTEENAIEIMQTEIKPITEYWGRVWASSIEESVNYEYWIERYNEKQRETINNTREKGIYFYNSLRRAIEQAIVTIEKIGKGNPALIILQTFDDIFIDPESKVKKDGTLVKWQDYKYEDERMEMPLVTFGKIQVIGISCLRKEKLKNKIIPVDIGTFLASIKYALEKKKTLDSFYFELSYDEMEENYYNNSFWICKCRDHKIVEEINQSYLK